MQPIGAKFSFHHPLCQLFTVCSLLTLTLPVHAQEEADKPAQAPSLSRKILNRNMGNAGRATPQHINTQHGYRGPADEALMEEGLPTRGGKRLAPMPKRRHAASRFNAPDAQNQDQATEEEVTPVSVAQAETETTSATASEEPVYVAANTSSSATSNSNGSNSQPDSSIDSAARMKNGRYSFDFNKGSIEDVIKLISEITHKNFIIPEKIKGQKLTILCPTRVSGYEAYQAFLSALEINGLTIIKSGNFYKVTNSKDAIKGPIPTYFDSVDSVPWQDTLVTILLPLKYIDAQNTSNLIKGMVSSDGTMTVFQQTNTLILSDYGNNIHRIKNILDKLDQEGGQEEMQIIPVENATASELAEKIKQIYDVDKKQGASSSKSGKKDEATNEDPTSGAVNISKIIPDDRTNQLIIVATHNSFQPILDLVQKLDTQLDEEDGQVRVYQLKNAVAEDIANTLSSLAQGKASSGTTNKAKKEKKEKKSGGADSAALFEGEVKITADKATNSLVIASSARDFRSVRKILEELDRPRLQVYVEGAILEVNVSNNKQFGTGWHSGIPFDNSSGDKNLSQGIGFIQSSSNSTLTTVTSASGVADLFNIFSGAIGGVLGEMITGSIGGTSVTIPSFGVVLKALRSDSNSKLLSEPYLTITDNEEGEVEVGQKIPFQEGYGSTLSNLSSLSSSTSSALSAYAGLYSRTDRIDVTLKMTLTPHINDSGKVRLEVDINIEDMVGKDEATGQPITATRKVKTVVIPDDHQTIVIGGLVRDRVRESESKIPFLGNIPVLGWLFKTRSWETEQVNLLIMLTPHIIRDRKDVENIARQRKAEFDRFQALFYGGTKEYRSQIGYARTNGMFATLWQEISNEMKRFENGGEGTEDEILITPTATSVDVSEEVQVEIHNSGATPEDGTTSEATTQP